MLLETDERKFYTGLLVYRFFHPDYVYTIWITNVVVVIVCGKGILCEFGHGSIQRECIQWRWHFFIRQSGQTDPTSSSTPLPSLIFLPIYSSPFFPQIWSVEESLGGLSSVVCVCRLCCNRKPNATLTSNRLRGGDSLYCHIVIMIYLYPPPLSHYPIWARNATPLTWCPTKAERALP